MFNYYFKDDEDLKDVIPIPTEGSKIFDVVTDGVILCKLVNKAVPGTIFEKAINKKKNMNVF